VCREVSSGMQKEGVHSMLVAAKVDTTSVIPMVNARRYKKPVQMPHWIYNRIVLEPRAEP